MTFICSQGKQFPCNLNCDIHGCNEQMHPEIESLYQHRYGGVYKVVGISFSTVDKTSWVVYEHCYPFEEQLWHRPYDEFCDGRFTKISFEEYLEIMRAKSAEEFQKEIAANKEAAKKN